MKKGILFGCYDPLHSGHIRLFRACKEYCDYLIVLVHNDNYIRKYKGREPWGKEEDRAQDISDITSVDKVVISDGMDRDRKLKDFGADIHFVSEEVSGIGYKGEVIRMPRTPNISSTKIRNSQ